MPSAEYYLGFLLATAIILAIPGPTILTVVSLVLQQGYRACVPVVVGVVLGDMLAVTLSLLGLGTLLQTSAWLYSLIRVLGAAYLIWLGLNMMLKRAAFAPVENIKASDTSHMLRTTFIVTALNPKSIVFFLAFLPQFVDPAKPATVQLVVLGATFVILGALAALAYALFAARASAWFEGESARRLLGVGGVLLCGAGVWALTSRRAG